MDYYILSIPEVGLLYETSPNFRNFGSDPKYAPAPIGAYELPFRISDPSHKVVYVPPPNQWSSGSSWASFQYQVIAAPLPWVDLLSPAPSPRPSEAGVVVLTTAEGNVAAEDFDLADAGNGWIITGNLEVVDGPPSAGLRHQAVAWGSLNRYVYGVDEVQNLDFASGTDLAKWYFEATGDNFMSPTLIAAYGGFVSFTVRSQYGDFRLLNDPLDWITIECASCDSGRGRRIIRFVDDALRWDGSEMKVSVQLHPLGRWMIDPLNAGLSFQYATECQIAAVLMNVSRFAILGDFTRGGEGIALDNVVISAADASTQPAYPLKCQKGCACGNATKLAPTCC